MNAYKITKKQDNKITITKKQMGSLAIVILFLCYFVLVPSASSALAVTPDDKYPRIANYYLVSNISRSDWEQLFRYDLLILPMEAQFYDVEFLREAKKRNPNIILLPYVPIQSVNGAHLDDPSGIRLKMMRAADDSWWLKDSKGNKVFFNAGNPPVFRPDIQMVNPLSLWKEYLPRFVQEELLDTNLWDGIFFDMVDHTISWMNGGDLDVDRDGKQDDLNLADLSWQYGIEQILKNTRATIGGKKIIVINGSSYQGFQKFINGRMFEAFPTPWHKSGQWKDSVGDYLSLPLQVSSPPAFVINTSRDQKIPVTQKARFGLASALLGDGYFSFDDGIETHREIYWFDEYNLGLGRPVGDPLPVSSTSKPGITEGIWRREFENGIVLVNALGSPKDVVLEGDFEKMEGSVVDRVRLSEQDGVLLQRPLGFVIGTPFPNNSFLRIFDENGKVKRTGFFVYEPKAKNRTTVLYQDLTSNGPRETIIVEGGRITISEYNKPDIIFYPFGKETKGTVSFAVADLDGDRSFEIVVGAPPKNPPMVKIFSFRGEVLHPGFLAYHQRFLGGVEVATGDLDGNGSVEIVTGARIGGGPHIRVFDPKGGLVSKGFFAFDKSYRTGVNIAVGDIDGDQRAEIIAGANAGAPEVKVFTGKGQPIVRFFAFDQGNSYGVRVLLNDIDGDGKGEILASSLGPFAFALKP